MNRDVVRTLLDAGVPQPPADRLLPPITAIRNRARRRRAVAMAGAAASFLLVAAGIGVVARGASEAPPTPAASDPVAGGATPWSFVVVDRDDRTLRVVGGPSKARDECDPGTVTLRAGNDPLTLTSVARPSARNCQFELSWSLDAPLGQRAVVDGSTNSPRPVLRENVLPRPTYPAGLSLARDWSHSTLNAPRPSWTIAYTRPDQTMVQVSATPLATAADLPASETITIRGHRFRIWDHGLGGATVAVWDTGEWQVSAVLEDAKGSGNVSRAEFERFLDGLVWS